jgi:CheY-like chemotaxis protein
MSRIESGKVSLEIQRIDLRSVVLAAMDAVRPAAEGKEVRLTSSFSSADGAVMGDKNRLQQVVWNLLSNAVKFSKKGGRVHVTTQRFDSHLAINVADNGAGIAPEHLERIFERFNQADSSTTRVHSGLGLGLSIAKHLVELHGGTIMAQSEGLGRGASFVVRLPLTAVHAEADRQGDPTSPTTEEPMCELAGIKVLAVDDEIDSAEVVRRILQRSGATVRTAGSMMEALSILDTFPADVIVSDIGMPEHDGYELIGKVRALPNGRKIAAVALTALARSEDRARALRAGFQMHVSKPVERAELTAAVLSLATLRGG